MRIHMDDSRTLKILDPWTMMYVEYEQEFIEEFHREIGPEHPLYRRDVFAIAVRRDPDAVIFQTADGEIYAIVHLTWSGRRAAGMPMTELLGRVDIHRVARTDPTSCIIAEKLVSVLS